MGGWTLFLSQNDLIPMQSGSSTMTHLQCWPDATGAVRGEHLPIKGCIGFIAGLITTEHLLGGQSPLRVSQRGTLLIVYGGYP